MLVRLLMYISPSFGLTNHAFAFLNVCVSRGSSQEFTNKVITLWYRPPELLLGATRYGTAVDIWSAGCILAELILGKPLFCGKTDMEQLQLIFEMLGTPTPETWDGFQDLKLLRTGEVTIGKSRKAKLRDKYQHKISSSALNLIEKLLELDPSKRLTADRALNSRYFLSEPRAPDRPEELGALQIEGGHFHEFQTKKKRKEAKVVAEKTKQNALEMGKSEKEAQEEFDEVYRGIMEKVAKEGLGTGLKLENSDSSVKEKNSSESQEKSRKEKSERKRSSRDKEKDKESRRDRKNRDDRRDERQRESKDRDREKDKSHRRRSDSEGHKGDDEKRRKRRRDEREKRRDHEKLEDDTGTGTGGDTFNDVLNQMPIDIGNLPGSNDVCERKVENEHVALAVDDDKLHVDESGAKEESSRRRRSRSPDDGDRKRAPRDERRRSKDRDRDRHTDRSRESRRRSEVNDRDREWSRGRRDRDVGEWNRDSGVILPERDRDYDRGRRERGGRDRPPLRGDVDYRDDFGQRGPYGPARSGPGPDFRGGPPPPRRDDMGAYGPSTTELRGPPGPGQSPPGYFDDFRRRDRDRSPRRDRGHRRY